MRARLLKPGFFMNEELAKLPVRARLLFAGLWCLADRDGRLEYRPERIRAAIFPYERVQVRSLLQTLERAGFVKSYQSVAGPCLLVAAFATHQHPHPKEPESKLKPEPCNYTARSGNSGTGPAGSSGSSRSGRDQDQDPPAAPVRTPAFKVYVTIASRLLDQTEDLDLDAGTFAEEFKRACAKQQLPYDATIVQKATDAARAGRARRRA